MATAEGHPEARGIAAAARAMLGWPFRPQGRGPRGVDCLGLVLLAAEGAGLVIPAPRLSLRGHRPDGVDALLLAAGLWRLPAEGALPGDVLLGFPAALQAHLGVRTDRGVVEAHAGLGRVVERPLGKDSGWSSSWRLPERG